MGNLIGRDTNNTSQPQSPPPPEPLDPVQVFATKNQFLECWTTQDVVEWLQFLSLGEFSELAETLVVDGDALILLASSLQAKNNINANNNNENVEEKEVKSDVEANIKDIEVPAEINKVISLFLQKNKETWPTLLEKIVELVNRYDAFMGPLSHKDEEFPPYEYPFQPSDPINREAMVSFYHDQTQHLKNKGSRSVERRWFSQPRIYRRYFGAHYIKLLLPPLSTPTPSTPYNDLLFTHSLPSQPLTLSSLSSFLFYSLSVSGRRDMWTLTSSPRSAWVKRVNPSSGGLHPIECYIILPSTVESPSNTSSASNNPSTTSSSTLSPHNPTPSSSSSPSLFSPSSSSSSFSSSSSSSSHFTVITGGVHHYAVRHHALELRGRISDEIRHEIAKRIGENAFIIGLSSIHWREVWKYGERGFRYSMLDSGHAYGSLAFAAARLGWRIDVFPFLETSYVEQLLGITECNKYLPTEEHERGLILAIVTTDGTPAPTTFPDVRGMMKSTDIEWLGTPNKLSADHKEWDIVQFVYRATTVEKADVEKFSSSVTSPPTVSKKVEVEEAVVQLSSTATLEKVITSRRSALEYINKPISLNHFVHILYSIVASNQTFNFPWPEMASLFIFAYNVDELTSGLYVLLRNQDELEILKNATNENDFAWTLVPQISSLPLYFLKDIPREKLSDNSYVASCNQHIASKGAFSLGMFVNISKVMERMGPSGYCRAHLECGALGQVLYLDAHALGLGATGMGCYLDDLSRSTFGLNNSSFWPLYHFAIGVPSRDDRYAPYDYTTNMFEGVLDECVAVMKPRNKK